MSWDIKAFTEKLEANHTFPDKYMFKFIVPLDKKEEVIRFLPEGKLSFKNSSSNKYVSVTLDARMESSDAVIEVYKQANQVEGLIAL